MELKLSVDLTPRSQKKFCWHEAEFQLRRGSVPYLTLRLLFRCRPPRVILVRRRQLPDSRLLGPEREWTWPPRQPAEPW